jgi:hypothetical protein
MNSTDRLGRAIVDADPLSRRRPALPSVDEEIVAARAFIGPVASPQPSRRSNSKPRLRRRVLVAGAATVAAAVALTLVSTNALSGSGTAAAAELRTVIANTEKSPPIGFEVRTYRGRSLDWVTTKHGLAYYWQASTITQTTSATLDTYRTDDAAPAYLTAADARRAATLPPGKRPHAGVTTQRAGCVSGPTSSCWPNPAGVAALPNTPHALAAALPVTCKNTSTFRRAVGGARIRRHHRSPARGHPHLDERAARGQSSRDTYGRWCVRPRLPRELRPGKQRSGLHPGDRPGQRRRSGAARLQDTEIQPLLSDTRPQRNVDLVQGSDSHVSWCCQGSSSPGPREHFSTRGGHPGG